MSTKVVVKKGPDVGVVISAKDIPIDTFFMGRLTANSEPSLFCRAVNCVVCVQGMQWTAVNGDMVNLRFCDYQPLAEVEITVKK